MENFAIDTGFGFIMAKSSTKSIMYSNLILEINEENISMIQETMEDDEILIKFKDIYFVLGDLTLKLNNSTRRHMSNNRTTDINHLAQIVASIALLKDDDNIQANIILGLPNKLAYKKSELSKNTIGKYEIDIILKDKIKHKNINIQNCLVVEQCISSIFNLKMDGIKKYEILSLDIGHNTTDITILRKGVKSTNPREWVNGEGVRYCFDLLEQELIRKFRERYGLMSIEENRLQEAWIDGLFKIKSQILDVTDITKPIYKKFANYIFHILEDNFSDSLGKADIIIASGGICNNSIFIHELSELLKQYNILFKTFGDAQWAVTNGMYKIINSKFKEETVGDK